jgi:WD40 repeat protein/formylglycine-generating enzyme required for sulfatase activity/serine/threonine protein kinase
MAYVIVELIGRTLGEFTIKEKLGEGGFGAVYRAEQPILDREVVIKVLRDNHQSNKEIIERFKREAHLASRLEHPYSAHIYSFGAESDGLLWIAMELVHGTPLDKLLKTQGPLPLERFIPLFDKICEVVHTAHEFGVIHRDIKPANVMIVSRAGRFLPKLLDFGIAKDLSLNTSFSVAPVKSAIAVEKSTLTDSRATNPNPIVATQADEDKGRTGVIGSPFYMAPEQWEIGTMVDSRTDIYALGVLAYEVLTGSIPFHDSGYALFYAHAFKPVPSLGTSFSKALDEVIQKAMAKKPDERYRTAVEFATALREASGFSEQRVNLPQLDQILQENILANAPRPLAESVANLVLARNAYQARDRMLIIFHVIVRYVGLLAIACHSRVGKEKKDTELIIKAIKNLRNNGLSENEWAELARELSRPFAKNRDAYPIPELVSLFFAPNSEQPGELTETFTSFLKLQHEVKHKTNLNEEEMVKLLGSLLPKLTTLLSSLSWLSDYYLVVPLDGEAEKWMGALKTNLSIELKSQNLERGKPVLVDAGGSAVVSLWPLIQVAEPTPGAQEEVFLLERNGRHGARLVSFPAGFEREDEAPWEWLKEYFFDSDEQSQSSAVEEKSPYLGLTAFSPNDAPFFFGREKETESFLNRLRVEPLLAVVGPSGAGKSSFVQAGVIPGLPNNWQTITVRPGASPIAALSAKLEKAGLDLVDLKASLEKDPKALGNALREFAEQQGKTQLLVIDQFEESFTLCLDKEERELYAAALVLAARSEEDPIRIILTMRDDFLVRAKELRSLKNKLTQGLEILTTPASAELLRILTEPARRAGYEFEDRVLPVEIVDAVTGQSSALPLLAFTAAKLWENRDCQFKQLLRRTYEVMGGVGGGLAKHAEELMEQMSRTEQSLVREAFRRLVTSEGTRAVLTRLELLQVLGSGTDAESVLEKLITSRLLVSTEGDKGIERIEVVHEALLSAWPRLVKWRQEDAEGARLRDQLRAASRQWHERGRHKGLLWRDEALIEYELWRDRYPGKLTENEEAFAASSLAEAASIQLKKRIAAIVAIVALVISSTVFFWQNQRTKRQLLETLELYEEQGRQELLKGNPQAAAVYLSEAYQKGADSLPLRYMLTQAIQAVEGRKPISLESHADSLTAARFSPDGKFIVTASADRTAKVWEAASGKLLATLDGHKEPLTGATFSPDGKFIVTSCADKTAKVWETERGKLLTTLEGHKDGLLSSVFSPDSRSIVTASYDKTAKVWEAISGKSLSTLEGHTGSVHSALFSPDGKLIVTVSADRTAKVWDYKSSKLLLTLEGHKAPIISALFSPDGKQIATTSVDKTVKIWDASSGKLLVTLEGHKAPIISALFSPDGKQIATASADKTAKIWDASSGKLLVTLEGHKGNVYSALFSPDGKLVLTASYDQSARLWETATGKFLSSLQEHKEPLFFASFSPDGKQVLTAAGDQAAKVWDMQIETRRPDEISGIVKSRVSLRLEQGRLFSAAGNQLLEVSDQPATDNNQSSVVSRQVDRVARPGQDVGSFLNKFEFETAALDQKGNVKEKRKEKADYFVEDLGNGLFLEMVKITGGTFMMGSPDSEERRNSDEGPQHQVTLPMFYMGKFEVTQAQWRAIASLPKINKDFHSEPGRFEGDDLPVEIVSWYDAIEFCARLSKATGREYRLPTEAEWEYACRAQTKTPFYFGETINPELVNYNGNSPYGKASEGVFRNKTAPVGSLGAANAFGLYDMHGNVWEWCLDKYNPGYNGAPTDGSAWITGNKNGRVLRGGSWGDSGNSCRTAIRRSNAPTGRFNRLGFRVVTVSRTF